MLCSSIPQSLCSNHEIYRLFIRKLDTKLHSLWQDFSYMDRMDGMKTNGLVCNSASDNVWKLKFREREKEEEEEERRGE